MSNKPAGGVQGSADPRSVTASRRTTATSPRWDQMTREERRAVAAEYAKRSAAEQGKPEFCEDPAVYAYIARSLVRTRKGKAA